MSMTGAPGDYFMEEARSELSQMTALCAWADANGVTLTDEEIAKVDDSIATRQRRPAPAATLPATVLLRKLRHRRHQRHRARMALKSALANKASSEYAASLEYTDAGLENYQSLDGAGTSSPSATIL